MESDIQLFRLLNGLAGQSELFDGIVVFFASYLAYILPVVLLVLVVFSGYQKRVKIDLLLTAAAASIIARSGITEVIRYFYHRPRPFSVLEANQLLSDPAWSFPSGHSTFFFALSTAVYLYNRKWGIGFFAATILITVSRVIAGVHYPSDILAGAIIGVLTAYFIHLGVKKIRGSEQNQTY